MMNRRRRSLGRKQRGFLLIALIALLAMGGLYFFVSNLTPGAIEARRQAKTETALTQAREALLGYALRYREDQINDGQYDRVYGYLPLPDLGSSRNNNIDPKCNDAGNRLEGCDAATNTTNYTVIGRFPWRTLGTEPLRDGNGECLWYVVSGSHDRIQRPTPMNWDTLGQLDVVIANSGATLVSALASAHDRPVAIIFSPGPPLTGQNRADLGGDDVRQCGGNYNPANYLDPSIASVQGGTSVYFSGSSTVDTSTTNLALAIQGNIDKAGSNFHNKCPQGSDCTTVANDRGLVLTNDALFGALRNSSNFRTDINAMLDRMTGCLRDQIASGSFAIDANSTGLPATPADKIAGRIPDNIACYGDGVAPQGYYSNYKEQIFVAKPNLGNFTANVDGVTQSCPGVLLLGGQRGSGQSRTTTAEKNTPSNYLEAINLTTFTTVGTTFAGQGQFSTLASGQGTAQDILRCIPAGASFTSVESTTLTSLGFSQLSSYDAASRTLTLGSLNVTTGAVGSANAAALFGCSWQPETHATGSGLRGYFLFNITNTGFPGPGFTFAAIDGDRNTAGVCGAASQHMGYSGNNGSTPIVAAPKIGVEFDTLRNYRLHVDPPSLLPTTPPAGFDPSYASSSTALNTLQNGRADPSYTGGHIAVVYWGSDTPISTGYACVVNTDCRSPSFCDIDNICKMYAEQDDNVHGQLPVPPAVRPPPGNPVAPPTPVSPPAYPPPGVTKLDPNLSSTPTNQNIHVRVEIERAVYAGRDDNSRLVKVVATNPITLSGLQTIDSVVLLAGDTVLVTAQIDPITFQPAPQMNGVYLASTGTWVRDASADEGIDLPPGTSWFIKAGTANAGSLWRLQNNAIPIINVTPLTIQRVRLPVRTVATAPITLSALQTVNGVALAAGDRVLVTAQPEPVTIPPTPSPNAVYVASSGAWGRAAPEDTAAGMKDGSMWLVSGGSHTGEYWRLNGDATPGSSSPISIALATANDRYSATVRTQVWMLADSVTVTNQIARMKTTTRAMAQLDPVVRYGQCTGSCPASNPAGQYCGGVETDTFRYCYTGQQPNLYDRQKVYDAQGSACNSGAACSGGQFCGIDNLCYQPALRTLRLGFTNSQSSRDQVISISNFSTTWLP